MVFIEGNREMNVGLIFKDFEEFSGYELIKTTKDLAYEGKKMNHCVGSYVTDVDSGASGIYRIENHTLELRKRWAKGHQFLRISQLRGYSNSTPPDDLSEKVGVMVENFNRDMLKEKYDDIRKDSMYFREEILGF